MHEVSETALITLRSRVDESEKPDPVLIDPVGRECLNRLLETVPEEVKERILRRKLSPVLTRHIALRARKYDNLCREFMEEYSGGLIVNLGCGFDTRFWRLDVPGLKYLELDLPGVIRIKREILGERVTYEMMEGSVLDESWIEKVREKQSGRVLFIAEGLFMYLPTDQVVGILGKIAGSFEQSRLVMEVVAEKYTRGWRKKMVEKKMRKGAGSTAGDYFQFGIQEAEDLESFHPGFKIRGEWSYFEDPDIQPAFLRTLRHFKSFSKTQYTVIADIN